MQERKKLIRIRGQRHPSNTIPWAILRQVMTPTLTRAAQSSKDNLQDQLEQLRCGWFAGLPVRPYLHHNHMNTTFAVSPFDRHRLLALRVTPSDLVEIAGPLLGRADTIQYWYFETGNPHRFVGSEVRLLVVFISRAARPSVTLCSCTFKMPPVLVSEPSHYQSGPVP